MSNKNTLDDTPPVFKTWTAWYLLVILSNVVFITFFYFFFKSL